VALSASRGFADICYVRIPVTLCESIARAEVDIGQNFSAAPSYRSTSAFRN